MSNNQTIKIQSKSEAIDEFDNLVREVKCPRLQKVCEELKAYRDFWTWPASTHHHGFETGLILHTIEVTSVALFTGKMFFEVDGDVLITAGLWHDLAKIWEYAKDENGNWEKTDYHGKVHHISGSTAEFTAVAMKFGVNREIIQKIQHCIIAHHMTKEWGSPRKPESAEAILIHQADMLSAMFPMHTQPVS